MKKSSINKDLNSMKLIHDIKNPILSITHTIEPLREFYDDFLNASNISAEENIVNQNEPDKNYSYLVPKNVIKRRRNSADNINVNKITKKASSKKHKENKNLSYSSINISNNKVLSNIFQNVNYELEDLTEMIEGFKFEFKAANNMSFNENPVQVNSIQLIQMFKNTHHNLTEITSNRLHLSIQKGFPNFINIPKSIVKRIINNFITNALKHTIDGCINIRFYMNTKKNIMEYYKKYYSIQYNEIYNKNKVNHSEKFLNDKYLCFSIEDSGIGITEDRILNIFNEKESDQSSNNWDGCGLGLPICKKLATQINSIIFYNSDPSVKTTFLLCMPYLKDKINIEAKNNKTNQSIPNLSMENDDLYQELSQSMMSSFEDNFINFDYEVVLNFNNQQVKFEHQCDTLIVAEDNKNINELYVNYAQKHNIKLKSFNNGRDCLDYFKTEIQYECRDCQGGKILITDFIMPHMDGLELARSIRSIKTHKSIKIVLLSADDMNMELINMSDLFDEVIEKPVRLSRFQDWHQQLIELNTIMNYRRNATFDVDIRKPLEYEMNVDFGNESYSDIEN